MTVELLSEMPANEPDRGFLQLVNDFAEGGLGDAYETDIAAADRIYNRLELAALVELTLRPPLGLGRIETAAANINLLQALARGDDEASLVGVSPEQADILDLQAEKQELARWLAASLMSGSDKLVAADSLQDLLAEDDEPSVFQLPERPDPDGGDGPVAGTNKTAIWSPGLGEHLPARLAETTRLLANQLVTHDDDALAQAADDTGEYKADEWEQLAACREIGSELLYPDDGKNYQEGKLVCRLCTVRAECLEYALRHDEKFGVWGGLSPKERQLLRRRAV